MDSTGIPYYPLSKVEVDRIHALRGLLCTMVFAFHYLVGALRGVKGMPHSVEHLGRYGSFSVQVFFALSGFLLFHSYSKSLLAPDRRANLAFYTKRIFRIYPVWILILFVFAYIHNADIRTYLSNLFFLFGLKPFRFDQILAFHSWSLYIEEIFYVSFPLIIFFYRKGMALNGLVLFLGMSFIIKNVINHPAGYVYYHPFNTFQYFFFGMVIYRFLPSLRKIKVPRIFFYLFFAAVIFISCTDNTVLVIWSYILFSFLILFGSPKEFSFSFLFAFRHLGLICYSFYLVHPLCQMAVSKFLRSATSGPPDFWDPAIAAQFLLSYTLTIVVAILIYFIVEKPFMHLGKNLTNKTFFYRLAKPKNNIKING